MIPGSDLHLLERIAQVGVTQLVEPHGGGVVGRDRHDGHALVLEVGVQVGNPLFICLGRRAVVAGEDHDQDLRAGEVLEGIGLAINAGQAEVGSVGTDRQRRQARRIGAGQTGRAGSKSSDGQRGLHGGGFMVSAPRVRVFRRICSCSLSPRRRPDKPLERAGRLRDNRGDAATSDRWPDSGDPLEASTDEVSVLNRRPGSASSAGGAAALLLEPRWARARAPDDARLARQTLDFIVRCGRADGGYAPSPDPGLRRQFGHELQ